MTLVSALYNFCGDKKRDVLYCQPYNISPLSKNRNYSVIYFVRVILMCFPKCICRKKMLS